MFVFVINGTTEYAGGGIEGGGGNVAVCLFFGPKLLDREVTS